MNGSLGDINIYKIERVSNDVIIKQLHGLPISISDTYPQDRIPKELNTKIMQKLSEEYANIFPEPKLKRSIDLNIALYRLYRVKLPQLLNLHNNTVSISKFYNPLFEKYWIDYVTNELVMNAIKSEVMSGDCTYIWIDLKNDEIIIALTNYKLPEVKIYVENDKLVLEICNDDVINNTQLLIYKYGDVNPVLGIVQLSHYYREIPYITATRWINYLNEVHIEVTIN